MSKKHKIERMKSSLGLPFSTAVRVGDIWELSGQIGLDPRSGKLVSGGVGPETLGEGTAPFRRAGVSPVEIVLFAIGGGAICDRQRFTGKLERKLQHPLLG